MPSKEALDLIEKVNALYSGALSQLSTLYTETMSQLITITVSILALVGVIIPALVSWLQTRQLSKEQKALTTEIENKIEQALRNMQTQYAEEFAKESEKFKNALEESQIRFQKELSRIEAQSDAKAFHLQAMQNKERKFYSGTLLSVATAATNYAKCLDESNLLRVWRVAEDVWPHINAKDFEDSDNLEEAVNNSLAGIASINTNGRYDDLLSEIKRYLKDAKARAAKQ